MDVINLQNMLAHARDEGRPTVGSCVDCVAAGMPPGVRLLLAYDEFTRLPVAERQRAYAKPVAAARLVARKTGAARTPAIGRGAAWGVVRYGALHAFAIRQIDGRWWARSASGVARVHASHVLVAWEIV